MNLERGTMNGFDFDYLNECFYIKDGVLFWRNRPSCHFKSERALNVFNAKYANKPSGRINNGYTQTKLGGKLLQNHRIIFFITKGIIPEIIDHIDGNSLNNNINNLRSTTVSKNAMNCRTSVKNTSGRKGVYFHRKTSKYTASIRVNGALTHLGTFVNFEDAVNARVIAEKKYYGDFSNDR